MENESDGAEAGEQISDSFICRVCLDLLYKPVVLACGHLSCFWCVHKTMSGLHESLCPICSHPYGHFPTICQILHFLLLKMYPVAYKTREAYILEEEKKMGYFSPEVDDLLCSSNTKSPQRSHKGSSGQVSIVDVSCATCKQLLFRPAVLNCGHVYCEACIMLAGEAIRCQVCQSPHPSGFPKVCLEFDHFLEEQFPEGYTARRGTVQLKQVQFQHGNSPTCSTKEGGFFQLLGENCQDVHIGVGCDSCGMYPIKGDRYRCIDCKEAIGFDHCGDCYNTRSKLPGRFNQQHTPDHRFEKEKSNTLQNIMLRLLRGESEDGLLPENELPLVAPSTASDSEEPQNDDTQPAI